MPVKLDLNNMIRDHARAHILGLGLHLLHQPGTLDRRGKAWIILDVRRDHQLAARLEARNQDRLQHGPRGVDRGRIAGRTRSNDDQFGVGGGNGLGSCRHEAPYAMASTGEIADCRHLPYP